MARNFHPRAWSAEGAREAIGAILDHEDVVVVALKRKLRIDAEKEKAFENRLKLCELESKYQRKRMARTLLSRPWTKEEIAELMRLLDSGATPLAVALKLRRRVTGVRAKIRKLQSGGRKQMRLRSTARRPSAKRQGVNPSLSAHSFLDGVCSTATDILNPKSYVDRCLIQRGDERPPGGARTPVLSGFRFRCDRSRRRAAGLTAFG